MIMIKMRRIALIVVASFCGAVAAQAQLKVRAGTKEITVQSAGHNYIFSPSFIVLFNTTDPAMALKPAGIKKVSYNVLTWKAADSSKADFKQKKITETTAGDGFDDRILRGKTELRTANVYNGGERTAITATGSFVKGDTVFLQFPASDRFAFKAYVLTANRPYPLLQYS